MSYHKITLMDVLQAVLGLNCGGAEGLNESNFDEEQDVIATHPDVLAGGGDATDAGETNGVDAGKTENDTEAAETGADADAGTDANVPVSANMECSLYVESANGMSYATLISSESPVQLTANGWTGVFKLSLNEGYKYSVEADLMQKKVSVQNFSGGETIFPMTWADDDKNPALPEADHSNEIFVTMQDGLNIFVDEDLEGVVSIGEADWPSIAENYLDINYLEFECY